MSNEPPRGGEQLREAKSEDDRQQDGEIGEGVHRTQIWTNFRDASIAISLA